MGNVKTHRRYGARGSTWSTRWKATLIASRSAMLAVDSEGVGTEPAVIDDH